MNSTSLTVRLLVPVCAIAFAALATGCSKSEDTATLSAPPVALSAQSAAAPPAKAASKLGNLSAFRSIAADVAGMVDKGDLPAAKARIKDLELAWNSAEAGLKPRAADDWHAVDKTVDHALKALRADTPRPADCKAAVADVLAIMDNLSAPK